MPTLTQQSGAIPGPSTADQPRRAPDPARPPSQAGVLGRLNSEWDVLGRSPSAATTVQAWERTEPALAGLASLGNLPVWARSRTTPVLRALLSLARRGDQVAERAVLQLMLGEAMRLARTAGPRDLSYEDCRGEAVTALWCAVRLLSSSTRPLPERPFNRLSLDVLKALTSRRSTSPSPLLLPPEKLDYVIDTARDFHHAGQPDVAIAQLLHWAQEQGHLSLAEATLLYRHHATTQHRRGAGDQLAAEMGLTWPALRQRISRLTSHVTQVARDAAANGDHTLVELAAAA